MGAYLVYHQEQSENEKDILKFSHILKPINSTYDCFSSMDKVIEAIKKDNETCLFRDGDFYEYNVIDLCTNTTKIVRATCHLVPTIIVE